ncbi:hypothetical protein BST61_g10054 [Cercospora zeina]
MADTQPAETLTIIVRSPFRAASPNPPWAHEYDVVFPARTATFLNLGDHLIRNHHADPADTFVRVNGWDPTTIDPPDQTLLTDLGFESLTTLDMIRKPGIKKGYLWDLWFKIGGFTNTSFLDGCPTQYDAERINGTGWWTMADHVRAVEDWLIVNHSDRGAQEIRRLDSRLRYGTRIIYDSQRPNAYAANKSLDWVGRDAGNAELKFELIFYDKKWNPTVFDHIWGDQGDPAWFDE